MTKYIVDIKGEIEGDYEIIGKYEEIPHGKWIKNGMVYRCSCCNHFPVGNVADEKFEDLSRLDAFYFCPHCGADMKEINNDK